MLYSTLYISWDISRPTPAASRRRKEAAIDIVARQQQSDLIIGLLGALHRNRLALVVLAASLAQGARSRARVACADSSAARWLARNAQAVREFLASISLLRVTLRQPGYRSLGRARLHHRLSAAPRRLPASIATHAPPAASATRDPDRLQLMTLFARL